MPHDNQLDISMNYVTNLFEQGVGSNKFYAAITNSLPPVFTRKEASRVLGGLYAPRTLANLDWKRKGPPLIRSKGKVFYERDSFVQWLKQQLK